MKQVFGKITKVTTGSEEFQNKEGKDIRVSTIEIFMNKIKKK